MQVIDGGKRLAWRSLVHGLSQASPSVLPANPCDFSLASYQSSSLPQTLKLYCHTAPVSHHPHSCLHLPLPPDTPTPAIPLAKALSLQGLLAMLQAQLTPPLCPHLPTDACFAVPPPPTPPSPPPTPLLHTSPPHPAAPCCSLKASVGQKPSTVGFEPLNWHGFMSVLVLMCYIEFGIFFQGSLDLHLVFRVETVVA